MVQSFNNSDCPICHGAGFVLPVKDGKVDYSHTVSCKCMVEQNKKRRLDMLLKICSLPPFAENMRFDNYEKYPEVLTAYKESKKMADNPHEKKWLALLGNNGNGKTHLGICVCRAWVNSGVPAKYTLVSLLLEELRQGYKSIEKENSYDAKFQMYCDIPLLLLDDYGLEYNTDWVQEKLDTLIDYRLMNNKSLIVTSNLSLDEMPKRIRSRLIRHPNKVIVGITAGEYSLRLKNEKTNNSR
jgi:DNA replication protein DnaC